MENLEVVTQARNAQHAVETGLIKTLPVMQIDPHTGEILKIYKSSHEATKETNIKSIDAISAMCHKKSKGTLAGYCWRYESDPDYTEQVVLFKEGITVDKICLDEPFYKKKSTVSVMKVDPETDEIIKVYNTVTEAAIDNGLKRHAPISIACTKLSSLSAGFHWRYIDNPLYTEKLVSYRICHPTEKPPTYRVSSYTPRNVTDPVLKIDPVSGCIIALYDNVKEAALENGVEQPTQISAVCRKTKNSTKGFIWRYADDDEYTEMVAAFREGRVIEKDPNQVLPETRRMNRPVLKIDPETSEIIEVYDSISKAARGNNLKRGDAIKDACTGKGLSSAGFRWKYADDPIYEAKLARFKRKQSKEGGPSKKKRKID